MKNQEAKLMAGIRQRWGVLITAACHLSSVPEAFLAALVANESGGRAEARRFEAGVFKHLRAVQAGTEGNCGSIEARHLNGSDEEALRGLATSWGLTQIMGYHILGRQIAHAYLLADPTLNLHVALLMLAEFAESYGLDVTKDFEEMLRCWNSGAPRDNPKTARIEGQTFDPKYVANGLARMRAWQAQF